MRRGRTWSDADHSWNDTRREMAAAAVAAGLVDPATVAGGDAATFVDAMHRDAEPGGGSVGLDVLTDLLRVWWDREEADDRDAFTHFGPYLIVTWPEHDDPEARWTVHGTDKQMWLADGAWHRHERTVVHVPTVHGRRAYFWSCLYGARSVPEVIDELIAGSYRTRADAYAELE